VIAVLPVPSWTLAFDSPYRFAYSVSGTTGGLFAGATDMGGADIGDEGSVESELSSILVTEFPIIHYE
jgi:hypothetical protein